MVRGGTGRIGCGIGGRRLGFIRMGHFVSSDMSISLSDLRRKVMQSNLPITMLWWMGVGWPQLNRALAYDVVLFWFCYCFAALEHDSRSKRRVNRRLNTIQ